MITVYKAVHKIEKYLLFKISIYIFSLAEVQNFS